MSNNNHEKQLLLKSTISSFDFHFSVSAKHLYISELSSDIQYGWESPKTDNNTNSESTIQFAYNKVKTSYSITLKGFIYINGEIGSGIDNFQEFQKKCNLGETWYLIDNTGKKVTGAGDGIWYIKSISQSSSEFITGINSLKISFTIVINRYK